MPESKRAPAKVRGSGSSSEVIVEHAEQLFDISTRRSFLKMLGVGGSIVLLPSVFTACDDDDDNDNGMGPGPGPGPGQPVTLNLSNDVGILNFAFALEQLEAAFYQAVVISTPFASFTQDQKDTMVDLRNHEVIHREFFRRAIPSANRIGDLALNSTTVAAALQSRDTIFRNAEAFEDLGVAAYNGAGKYLTDANNLLVAGKIVSVEARHAAAIRDIREQQLGVTAGASANTRFAGDDVVIATGTFAGLDVKLEPSAVLTRVGATNFVSTQISIGTQPPTRNGTPDFGPPSPTP